MSWFSMKFKKETGGCLALYLLLFITIPSIVFNIVWGRRAVKVSELEWQIEKDSVRIANLEADILKATGHEAVHDTVWRTQTEYIGEDEALGEIYKRLDKIEEYIINKSEEE